jgi:tetratricopeptide (TPR) repeat protein
LLLYRGLRASGSHKDVVELLQRAQQAHPGDFWINEYLGRSLQDSQPPRLDEAIRFLTAAVALRPDSAGARLALGDALEEKGRLDDAITAYRQIIDLKPDYPRAHHNLLRALIRKGGPKEAVAFFRKATKQQPTSALAHEMLGGALFKKRDLPGAAACYRRVVQIGPRRAEAHYNLGHVLLRQEGPRAALAPLQTGHRLGSPQADWPYPSAWWVRRCKRFIELDRRLPAILKGKARPAGTAERLDLAELCGYKGLHVTAVRFFTEALDADAKRASDVLQDHRYRAACSAAQASCGQGKEAARLDEAGRARLRQQALQWLRDDLAVWARQIKGGIPRTFSLEKTLRGYQIDHALAGVRDADRLAVLPSAERAEWQKLWADVAATRTLARDGK